MAQEAAIIRYFTYMPRPSTLCAIVFALASLSAAPVSAAARPACTAPVTVGFRVMNIGTIKTAVWYPATQPESAYAYLAGVNGSVALNATPAACGSFPMVLFSHGYTGCSVAAVYITEQIARNGYIVAAPDHADAGCTADGAYIAANAPAQPSDPAKWTDQTLVNRKNDIAGVLAGMLASPDIGPAIDPSRIGAMGHSFGGTTIQGMIGGWSAWYEPRIRAALLFSPYSEPFRVQGKLGNMRVPAMYQGGTLDYGITPTVARAGGSYENSPAPKFFAELIGADHNFWTDGPCYVPGSVAQCLAISSAAKLIVDYGTAFLDRYLRGMDAPLLWQPGTGLADYRHTSLVTTVSAAGFQDAPVAPDSIVAIFGEGFPAAPQAPGLAITDSAGVSRPAQVFFQSANQINALLPAGTAVGKASVAITAGTGTVGMGDFQVVPIAPGLFSSSQGTAAGQAVTVNGTTQSIQPLTDGNGTPIPVDLTSGDVYLVLYGTGIRAGASSAVAQAGAINVPIYYLGPQSITPGLDQVTLGPIPQALAGAGAVAVSLTVGKVKANAVSVTFGVK